MLALGFLNSGLISYSEGRKLQNSLIESNLRGEAEDTIIFCEHPPTITLGIRSQGGDVLADRLSLTDSGTEIVVTDRGGRTSAHEPGQLVLYPVINLRRKRLSAKCAAQKLLEAASSALNHIGLPARTNLEPAGIFINGSKVGSIGLRISRGVTNHGLSINVSNSLRTFDLIVPCGLTDIRMTSVSRESERDVTVAELIPIIEKCVRTKLE